MRVLLRKLETRKHLYKMNRPGIKVCGLRDNIGEVLALKPDYVGFIFYPKSPRFVGKQFDMPTIDSSISKVGVYVNEEKEFVVDAVKSYQLDYVQLHGDEIPEVCEFLKSNGIGVIKAFRLDGAFDFKQLDAYKDMVDYFLFDTKTGKYGGSGKTFEWELLSNYKLDKEYFLSGGIGLENLDDLKKINLEKVHAIDVNSRIEVSPGLKDVRLLKKLFNEFAHSEVGS